MRNFEKTNNQLPAISTASLPDIVFMLLFFFMTVTTIKTEELLVENKLPQATETEKLVKRDRVIEIYVGKSKSNERESSTDSFQIQMESNIVNLNEVPHVALKQLTQMSEHVQKAAIVSLKADKAVTMGVINDLKEKLREVNLLKINYTVIQGDVF